MNKLFYTIIIEILYNNYYRTTLYLFEVLQNRITTVPKGLRKSLFSQAIKGSSRLGQSCSKRSILGRKRTAPTKK